MYSWRASVTVAFLVRCPPTRSASSRSSSSIARFVGTAHTSSYTITRACLCKNQSRAGRESPRILDRLERGALGSVVLLRDSPQRVGHRDPDADICQAGGEDPVAVVGAAAVEDLDDHLHIRAVEEPEVSGVVGQGH